MSIIKATFDKMLKKIPARKSNEEMYQDVNWTFSIVYYIEKLMVRLELRDERIHRRSYTNPDFICELEELARARFKKKFQILIRELMDTKKDISIDDYVKYYLSAKGAMKKLYFYRDAENKVHTMSASIKRVKQIPEGAICL